MLQLVSRHVIAIEIQEIGFKRFGTELRRVAGLHQILAGNVITCLEPLLDLNCQCRFKFCMVLWLHLKEIFFLGLGLTVIRLTSKKYKKH